MLGTKTFDPSGGHGSHLSPATGRSRVVSSPEQPEQVKDVKEDSLGLPTSPGERVYRTKRPSFRSSNPDPSSLVDFAPTMEVNAQQSNLSTVIAPLVQQLFERLLLNDGSASPGGSLSLSSTNPTLTFQSSGEARNEKRTSCDAVSRTVTSLLIEFIEFDRKSGGGFDNAAASRADEPVTAIIPAIIDALTKNDIERPIDVAMNAVAELHQIVQIGRTNANSDTTETNTVPTKAPRREDRRPSGVPFWEIPYEEIVMHEKVGEGAFGDVYRARLWGTDVAVKKMRAEFITDDLIHALKREIKILSRLRHPHIVLYMGACTKPPNVCIVTEFMKDGSLFEQLYNSAVLMDMNDILNVALATAKAMAYLHQQSPMILHRDLKSLNLLVDEGKVKLCDFGLSVLGGGVLENISRNVGTAQWMAPEMLAGKPYDEKVDVYSYGVLLSELITRNRPFLDKYAATDFIDAVINKDERPSVPKWAFEGLSALLEACWHPNPKMRPPFSTIVKQLRTIQSFPEKKILQMDIQRISYWLHCAEPARHEMAVRQLVEMDQGLVLENGQEFLRRIGSFLWRADGPLLLYVVKALNILLKSGACLKEFARMDAVPSLVSHMSHSSPEIKASVMECLAYLAESGGVGVREQLTESLLGLGLLKDLFKDPTPAAHAIVELLAIPANRRNNWPKTRSSPQIHPSPSAVPAPATAPIDSPGLRKRADSASLATEAENAKRRGHNRTRSEASIISFSGEAPVSTVDSAAVTPDPAPTAAPPAAILEEGSDEEMIPQGSTPEDLQSVVDEIAHQCEQYYNIQNAINPPNFTVAVARLQPVLSALHQLVTVADKEREKSLPKRTGNGRTRSLLRTDHHAHSRRLSLPATPPHVNFFAS